MFLPRHGSVTPPVRLKALKADEGYGQVDEHLAGKERERAAGFLNCAVSFWGHVLCREGLPAYFQSCTVPG
jgi:hypothetical protein